MSGTTTPSGIDFTQGIALADIPDAGVVTGHVGDDAVLLARVLPEAARSIASSGVSPALGACEEVVTCPARACSRYSLPRS